MCGISGVLQTGPQAQADEALVRAMAAQMGHRGPDGSGQYVRGPVGLGHTRLSIIDLEGGAQPMPNEDGSVWVVFNGEIYNFRELRASLEAAGHRFRTASDTEVIVHLYEDLGEDCIAQLNGMFALALWDERRRKLLLARDRLGIKPLYYARTPRSLLFASEIKPLLCDPAVARGVNLQAIDRFLTHYYLPGTQTLFDGVQRLAPGHWMTVQDGRTEVRPYWDLRFDTPAGAAGYEEAVEALRGLLGRSVRDHLISDVPVGVLLSGGVDSTGVLAHAAGASAAPLHSFTMGFDGEGFADERPYARIAAQRFGTVHHEVSMSAAQFRDYLPAYVRHMEEPVCEPPAIALHFLARAARHAGVKVLLSGEGGDEAFGGYPEYRNLLMLERLKAAAPGAPWLLRGGFQALRGAGWRRGSHYAALSALTIDRYYLSRTATPHSPFNRLKAALYRPAFAEALGRHRPDDTTHALWRRMRGQPLLSGMLYVDSKTWLPDDLLVKADRMTMAASVELRVPLLDPRILEFAASLPAHFKVRGWTLKRILKDALSQAVPAQILSRRKTGFPVPYARWLRHELRGLVFDALLDRQALTQAYFRRDAVERLLRAHDRGEGGSKEVFSLLVLELWHREFADAGGAGAWSPAEAPAAAPARPWQPPHPPALPQEAPA
ncbi:asparagine synthase (glutamine-hydrolyzing) [Aquincola sp. MAHUQ-54]|uniref:asparagine synthase (glutamine-hydrolyzing) n=1 Tax=Aquincola agrisoli TaxID=3119538 RepID=A0AAW9QMT4_9BURK